jgi:hypothetical protein
VLTGDELAGPAPLELSDLGLLRHLQLSAIRSGLWQMLGMQLVRNVPVTQPAVGAEWTITSPPGVIWELLAVSFVLTTSAVAGNRGPSLRFRTADNVDVMWVGTGSTQGASIGLPWSWMVGLGAALGTNTLSNPLPSPPIPLTAGWRILSQTNFLDAGDQFSNISVTVREWTLGRIEQFAELLLEDADSTGLLGKLIGG